MLLPPKRGRRTIACGWVCLLLASAVSAQQRPLWNALVDADGRTVQRLDMEQLREQLANVGSGPVTALREATARIDLPMPDGHLRRFRFLETPVMHPDLQARYPRIRTYTGSAEDDHSVRVKFDLTPQGFHAFIQGGAEGEVFIDPPTQGQPGYRSYAKRDARMHGGSFVCSYDQVNDIEAAAMHNRELMQRMAVERAGDCRLRTYRLALACTAEYANYHGSNTTNNDRSFALAAMVTTINRVNGIYERDATLTLQLIGNDDALIFLDPATDGYTNDDRDAMLDENQAKCDGVIGSVFYDIGHVFGTTRGGVAVISSVCTANKARGVTGLETPEGDPFDVDYVAHEIGHQFGANHTQNNDCNRIPFSAVEVGSGITVMGYSGVCAPDVAVNSDAMLGGYSLAEVAGNVTIGAASTCPSSLSLVNMAPTADAGADITIPKGTPFVLTGSAADADATDALTYSWEQMDNAVAPQPPLPTNTGGPCFRPFLPVASPSRYVPQLSALAAGITPTWEVLSDVARQYKFRFTVRDNATGGGCNAQDNTIITVAGTAGPFVVTQPNTALTWTGGSTRTITWDVAGTNAAPVNCANADILLSTDGGLTYPYTLATATANDGSADVVLPDVSTSTARVMVRGTGNIFFDISDTDFAIIGSAPVRVAVKLFLEGPYVAGEGLMHDSLRVQGVLPLTEPYTALGFASAGGGGEVIAPSVLQVSGPDAIVDWVRIELRAEGSPATVMAAREALVQRDGDVVDVDGSSPVAFLAAPGNYHVAVRHRNHLGCMTAGALPLNSTATAVDLRTSATPTYGTNARKAIGGAETLWMGNVLRDGLLKYTGVSNDRDPILVRVGGVVATAIVSGYFTEDGTMDGRVIYTGPDNDRDPILVNVGGTVHTAVRVEQLP